MRKFINLMFILVLIIVTFTSCKKETVRTNISGSVMLYSSMDEATLRELKTAFEAKYPGITMDYYFSTVDRVNNRLSAENSVKQLNCDVIWAGSQLDFENYKASGYLEPYKSKERGAIHRTFRDKGNYYTGARAAAVGFGYKTDNQTKVKSYNDLLSENLREKTVVINPDRATIVKLFVASMMQNKKYGEAYFEKLFANGLEVVESADDSKSKVLNDDKAVCLTIDYLNVKSNDDENTYTFRYPNKDVVFYYTPIGLAKGALNPDNGKLLIDFILSKSGQNIITANGNFSTRKDLKNVMNTKRYFSKAMKIDMADMHENIDSYMERFNNLR